ncbi:hypothetical protein GCM10011335_11930 [Aureimonas glaciei]|uniref:Uncharacterized protein n=1 Tax=Aureimonas glaciei TaxID=1776957 RepID=A0A916XUG2_9HYPH|nr:hypothetical protein GCM10011335_11930 [Aureimonas glaciei]
MEAAPTSQIVIITARTSQVVILTAPTSQLVILGAVAPGIHAATGMPFDGFLGSPPEPSRAPQRRGMDPRPAAEDDEARRAAPPCAAEVATARGVTLVALSEHVAPTIPTAGEF